MQKRSSNRLDRINEELKKEISYIINYGVKNSKVTGMISVTKANISPDLRYAKIYVSVINSKNKKDTLARFKIRFRIYKEQNSRKNQFKSNS